MSPENNAGGLASRRAWNFLTAASPSKIAGGTDDREAVR